MTLTLGKNFGKVEVIYEGPFTDYKRVYESTYRFMDEF